MPNSKPAKTAKPAKTPRQKAARFSAKPAQERAWHKLDNTANLFPVITSKKETNVYRLAVNLTEDVDGALLQQALEDVLPHFAALRVRLHKGLFWHYLEANPGAPQVREEDDYPCRVIIPQQNNYFLFRVSYCKSRINLEVYHVLTDGTGGFQFLSALTCRYLILAHPTRFSEEEKARQWFSEHARNTEDSYAENYTPTKKTSFNIGRGFRIRGERAMLDDMSVIHAYVPVKDILAVCRQKGVTISHYLTAAMAYALYTSQLQKRPSKYPVNVFVPVNLRTMFPSTTALNFFSNIYISLVMDAPNLSFDDVLAEVKCQFEEKLSRDAMLEKISYTVGNGRNPFLRAVPLMLKMPVLRLVYRRSAKSSTMAFSNVGRVDFPEPFVPFLAGAHVLLSTVPQEPVKCAACSQGGVFTISFTSTLKSHDLQRSMLRMLAADGLAVTIETNGVDNENL